MPRQQITLPDFAIIGANKAGTTSVAAYLAQHPSIGFSKIKEPMFFSSNPKKINAENINNSPWIVATPTLLEYSSLFDNISNSAVLFGEASTAYLATPEITSKFMKKLVPNIKLIAILREPVSRAISGYRMCFSQGIETRPFSEIVTESYSIKHIKQANSGTEYLRLGLYSQLIKPFLQYFSRNNILFIKYDDLASNPSLVMSRITEFLGVGAYKFRTDFRLNTANLYERKDIVILKEHIDILRSFYSDDIKETQASTGLDLSNWL